MVRVVTQETFDSLVLENIEDFGLSTDEAIDDTVKQFQALGVDLSNIIKDLIVSRTSKKHSIVENIEIIKEALGETSPNIPELISSLAAIKVECDKDIAHKLLAAKEGAYIAIIECIAKYENECGVLLASIETLVSLMDGQPDILEKYGVDVMNCLLEKQTNDKVIMLTLKWITTCCRKHENNRQNIFKSGILTHLKNMMESHKDPLILVEVCSVLRHLVLDDDVRVEYGQAHEHARLIATETLHILTQMLADFKLNEDFIADILLTIAALVVRHEFCQKVDDVGGVQFILDVMLEFHNKEMIIRQCFKLLKALAGNDDVKRKIIKLGGAPLISTVLDTHKNTLYSAINGLGCISALALREIENSKALYDAGIPEVILQCMNIHENNLYVQRNGSWAIRNMVARCPEQRCKFLEMNAENLLNRALENYGKETGQDIKCALKDLGCNVKLEEQWTGKGGKIHTCEKYNEFNEDDFKQD